MQVELQRRNRPKWHKRWWFRLLIRVAGDVATGAIIGAVVDIATTVYNELAKGFDIDNINPSDAEIEQAKVILQNKAMPLINNISNEIENIKNNYALPETKITSLNKSLNKIEILQAWVNHRINYENEKVDLMVAAIIEPLLIKLKVSINKIIITQLQNNVEKQVISFTPSSITILGSLNLPWNSVVTSSYEKLVYVQQSNTITIITPSVDNPELVHDLESSVTTTANPQDNNSNNEDNTVKIVVGIGAIALFFKLLSNYNYE